MDMRVNLALPGDLTDVEERGGEAEELSEIFWQTICRLCATLKIIFQATVNKNNSMNLMREVLKEVKALERPLSDISQMF